MKMKKKKFTLIELIIVIVVIGILAGMALPKFMGVQRNAKAAGLQNDCDVLQTVAALIETERSQDDAPYGSLKDKDISTPVTSNDDMKKCLGEQNFGLTDKVYKLDESIYKTKLSKGLKTADLNHFGIITTGALEGTIIYLGDTLSLDSRDNGGPDRDSNGIIDGNNKEWFGLELTK